mmetsp:Transcript_74465/g.209979  ORF Transcript_74465/g.209979 Transcript_74465/m.209979 type:complete len:276 (+) Transcript_74465:68-895(+)
MCLRPMGRLGGVGVAGGLALRGARPKHLATGGPGPIPGERAGFCRGRDRWWWRWGAPDCRCIWPVVRLRPFLPGACGRRAAAHALALPASEVGRRARAGGRVGGAVFPERIFAGVGRSVPHTPRDDRTLCDFISLPACCLGTCHFWSHRRCRRCRWTEDAPRAAANSVGCGRDRGAEQVFVGRAAPCLRKPSLPPRALLRCLARPALPRLQCRAGADGGAGAGRRRFARAQLAASCKERMAQVDIGSLLRHRDCVGRGSLLHGPLEASGVCGRCL